MGTGVDFSDLINQIDIRVLLLFCPNNPPSLCTSRMLGPYYYLQRIPGRLLCSNIHCVSKNRIMNRECTTRLLVEGFRRGKKGGGIREKSG